MPDENLIHRWFVYCANCDQELVIMTAPGDVEPLPLNTSWQGTCPECGTVHTYQPSEVHLTDE
jgi:hypothetical protein